jgi:spore coat protein CotH
MHRHLLLVVGSGALAACNRFKEPELFNNFDPDHVVLVELSIDESDWDTLRNESRSFFSEFNGDCMSQPFYSDYTTVPADIVIDGESLDNIGIRKKGFIGSQSTEKPSLKINLDEYEDGAELFGVDNVTLNNAVQDPSLIRQCLGYQLFADAGLPASRCNFAHVFVNGADMGIYVHVEPVKRSFLRDHFSSDDGDLYEGTLSDVDPLRYRTFEPKNEDTDPSLSDLIALKELLESPPSPLRPALEAHIDLDAFLTFWAMETIIGHWDGYAANHNNYYMYKDPATDLFTYIPWGLDDGFDPELLSDDGRGGEDSASFSAASLPGAILADAELSEMFYQRLQALMDSTWKESDLLAEVDRIEALLASEVDISDQQDGIDGIRAYISARRAHLEASLPMEPMGLMPTYCIREVGSLSAEFEAQWDTMDAEDLTRSGESDMDLFWGGPVDFVRSGAVSGPSDDDESYSLLLLPGLLDDRTQSLLLPYFYFEHERALSDGVIPLAYDTANGGSIFYTDASIGYQFYQAAMIDGGEISFDSYDPSAGGVISGRLSTTLFNWEELSQ